MKNNDTVSNWFGDLKKLAKYQPCPFVADKICYKKINCVTCGVYLKSLKK